MGTKPQNRHFCFDSKKNSTPKEYKIRESQNGVIEGHDCCAIFMDEDEGPIFGYYELRIKTDGLFSVCFEDEYHILAHYKMFANNTSILNEKRTSLSDLVYID